MFGISIYEFGVILIVLAIVTNPKDIPSAIKNAKKTISSAIKIINSIKNYLHNIITLNEDDESGDESNLKSTNTFASFKEMEKEIHSVKEAMKLHKKPNSSQPSANIKQAQTPTKPNTNKPQANKNI